MLKREQIRIRDPFILPIQDDGLYYMYGSTDLNTWGGPGTGFDVYSSKDLDNWEGPFEAFRPEPDFWADRNFWAPEVYAYNDRYYMFASFKSEDRCRGTQVLVAEHPLGPFRTLTDKPVTPEDWECLDGTLYVDADNKPWMVFCHEWIQVQDGKMCAIPLTDDLREAAGEPILLFTASQAPWSAAGKDSSNYVTDGPYLYHTENGELHMLWSSGSKTGYAIGSARSESGTIEGPWLQDETPLFAEDGGHGMLFRTFEGQLMLSIHAPNKLTEERAVFIPMTTKDGRLQPS
jgi:arabinan endo-1,5-alpha-L-arabinosidase